MQSARLPSLVLLLLAASAFPPTASGQESEAAVSARHKAAQLFSSSCRNCHLPPDPAFATDRAWLTQVKDTA